MRKMNVFMPFVSFTISLIMSYIIISISEITMMVCKIELTIDSGYLFDFLRIPIFQRQL